MLEIFQKISVDTWYAVGAGTVSFLLGFGIPFINRIIAKSKTKKCKYPLFCADTGKEFTRLHSQVNEIITEVRLALDCARVTVAQFHNGGDFFSGESILKYSITHESCGLGVTNSLDSQQGILLTRYVEQLKILQEDEPRIIFTNTLHDSSFKGFMESRNTIAFIIIPLILSFFLFDLKIWRLFLLLSQK